MNETTISFIRHGETEWNVESKQQWYLDSNLTSLGIKQAELIAESLKKNSYDIIYSSDLGRALHTAEILNKKLNLPLIENRNLRERKLGIMEGLTMDEFKNKFPNEFKRYITDIDYIIPKGESAKQFYTRTVNAIEEIIKINEGKKVMVITHGGNLSCIFRKVFDISLDKKRNFSLLNASMNTFVVNDHNWKLITWGNVSHLENNDASDDF